MMALDDLPKFEDLKVTTMTIIIKLSGKILLTSAFNLLPITKVNIPVPKRQSKKCKIPHHNIPGAILSMRHFDMTRGIIRTNSTTYFKNSITIDIDAEIKNVSMKLSSNTIQMCGASSKENGKMAAKFLLDHIYKIQYLLDYIHDNYERSIEIKDMIVEFYKGEKQNREISRLIELPRMKIKVFGNADDYVCQDKSPEEINQFLERFEDEDELKLAKHFISFAYEHQYISDLDERILYMINTKRIFEDEVKVEDVRVVMVNYNYDLNFHVNRNAVFEVFNGNDGFIARYDNAIEHNVTIELPFENDSATRKKNKKSRALILLYKSGLNTLSSSSESQTQIIFEKFIRIIRENRDKIISKY